MTYVVFSVPGQPIAQPRHKAKMIAGHSRLYIPHDHPVHGFKTTCHLIAKQHFDEPIITAVQVKIVAVFRRPRRIPKRQPDRQPHVVKPDTDNVAKAVLDSLNRVAFYDDSQVSQLAVYKWYAALDEEAHTVIAVTKL